MHGLFKHAILGLKCRIIMTEVNYSSSNLSIMKDFKYKNYHFGKI